MKALKSGIVFAAVAAVAAMLAGCMPDPVVCSEVFQLGEGDCLYTKYNIWYTDPQDISCLNIQQGTFIPIGTEIEPIGTDYWTQRIRFRDKEGKEYAIHYNDGYRITSMRNYIEYTFTTEKPEKLFEGIQPKALSRIRRGEVVPGMTQKEVLLAYGPPPAARTPDLQNETWIYWVTPSETIRLIFRGDTVRQILNINL
ncbi:MAG: hypothetical protein MJ016_03725 [Victivallaceae bacterium]|nr:hypothetical protein [Victivallaceae bacterium]